MLFNVAQSYRLAGERDKAITAYRSYIRSAPRGEQRTLAEAKLRDLEEQRASAPSPTPPVASAAHPSIVSPPAVPPQTPGPNTLGDRPRASSQTDQTNVLVATPSPEPPKSSPFYARWPFWTVTGAVVVGAVVVGVVVSRGGNSLNMSSATLGTKGF